ncbi:MAG: diaminopimelate decarboxylase [Spirochaetes bacterium]|uniref:Diaminopimelate decarboxylase n=1 Tax=Candidatus Ornithospirochaeta stercoripullorum TaxID=2840899 RepID=A0A9D9H6R0_9SPIO|nr:diaminopimelate decarboxylase [Candidatus Ornithospirochaeta stercoripullorum]
MSEKNFPLSSEKLRAFAEKHGTPFHIYDGIAIEDRAKSMLDAFSWSAGFINYFAVKALPNINILRLLYRAGFGADCSSLAELYLAKEAGIPSEKIMFSSNDTSDDEFREAIRMGVILNLDDESYIDDVLRLNGELPETISFRYNPGRDRTGNAIIGNPVEAKYGVTHAQLANCYKRAKELGVKRFFLHTMVASNELNEDYIVETARMLFSLVDEIYQETGIRISQLDLGGGIGIPYRPEDNGISFYSLSEKIRKLYEEMIDKKGLGPVRISFECGRAITGPFGYLVSKVQHVEHKYRDYIGLDACMADLMRPGMYGAYHHITVSGKEHAEANHVYDVTGSLCENNDKFAIQRALPEIERGDLLIIHDTGAHGHSMGFNYNGRLRHAEYMILEDGIYKIRRDESYEDYIRTMLKEPEKA